MNMKIAEVRYNPGHGDEPDSRNSSAGVVELPLSKSVALRVMTLNGVCRAQNVAEAYIPEYPDAEDVEGMERALDHLTDAGGRNCVYIGEGGAPVRFFTALAASVEGVDLTVSGSRGLMKRPLGILLDGLREAGADVRSLRRESHLPLRIIGRRLKAREIEMNPGVSSQFISALLLASPLWTGGQKILFVGATPVSMPYIRMTLEIMSRFGIKSSIETDEAGNLTISTPPALCSAPKEFPIEPDWSAASYFYEAAILLPDTPVRLKSLTPSGSSLQGDSRCAEIFGKLGVETKIAESGEAELICRSEKLAEVIESREIQEWDMNDTPDLVPALAVGFALAGVRFCFTSVHHLRHKETDRLASLQTEMCKLGYVLQADEDSLFWDGELCKPEEAPLISTYSDHRMAMAFAPAACRFDEIKIERPEVVGKSFPRYCEMLSGLGFQISNIDL